MKKALAIGLSFVAAALVALRAIFRDPVPPAAAPATHTQGNPSSRRAGGPRSNPRRAN